MIDENEPIDIINFPLFVGLKKKILVYIYLNIEILIHELIEHQNGQIEHQNGQING